MTRSVSSQSSFVSKKNFSTVQTTRKYFATIQQNFDSFTDSKIHLRKVMIIPYTICDGELYYLMVHDARHKEWSFISGGCKGKPLESYIDGAYRELQEETRNIIDGVSNLSNTFKFDTWLKGEDDRWRAYRIYFLPLEITGHCIECISKYFQFIPPRNKFEAENNDIRFIKPTEISKMSVWKSTLDVLQHTSFTNEHNHSIRFQPRYNLNIPHVCPSMD